MSAEASTPPVSATTKFEGHRVPELLAIAVAFGLAAASFLHFGVGARGFISALFVVALVWLSVIDIEQGLLPDRIVLPATAVILVLQLIFFPDQALEWILATLGAGLVFLIAFLSYRTGLGFGDVKFAMLLGAGLGQGVVLGAFLGLFASGIAGLLIIARHGLDARKQTIPLGPFLALGAIISLFFSGGDFVSF